MIRVANVAWHAKNTSFNWTGFKPRGNRRAYSFWNKYVEFLIRLSTIALSEGVQNCDFDKWKDNLNLWYRVKSNVEYTIQKETDNVERKKIEI